MLTALTLAATLLATPAQMPGAPTPDEMAAMKKLDRMVGKWEGGGWSMMRGSKSEFTGTENIQWKLHNRAILVEGQFFDLKDGKKGEVIHETLGVITFDPKQNTHLMRAYLFNMSGGEYKLTTTADGWIWGFDLPTGDSVRYTGTFGKDDWTEIGEYLSKDRPAFKFFEMKLKRVSA